MEIKVYDYKPTKNVFYRVVDGDDYNIIAKKFSVPVDYILQNNPGEFYVGKVLFIPEVNLKTYIVKPFDTLKKIASLNAVSIESLKEKNNLNDEYVFVGQKIYL